MDRSWRGSGKDGSMIYFKCIGIFSVLVVFSSCENQNEASPTKGQVLNGDHETFEESFKFEGNQRFSLGLHELIHSRKVFSGKAFRIDDGSEIFYQNLSEVAASLIPKSREELVFIESQMINENQVVRILSFSILRRFYSDRGMDLSPLPSGLKITDSLSSMSSEGFNTLHDFFATLHAVRAK